VNCLGEKARRLVVKIGTNSLTEPDGTLVPGQLESLAGQVAELKKLGYEVILVSSGAVGLGMREFKLDRRPTELARLQACAALGQGVLIEAWRKAFAQHRIAAAQILLTREDVRERKRSVAVRQTIEHLLSLEAVPIINENDTVSADEIKFGDNDVLSALSAILIDADLLVILSTIPGLLDRQDNDRLIPVVEAITPEITALAGGTDSATATGGMTTKLEAARLATESGCGCFIGDGQRAGILTGIVAGKTTGTFFSPSENSLVARKRWIAYFAEPKGKLILDDGAVEAVLHRGSSLLAKGITAREGKFEPDDVVDLCGPDGVAFARGMVLFSPSELDRILGRSNQAVKEQFPERRRSEVIHRDSLVLLGSPGGP